MLSTKSALIDEFCNQDGLGILGRKKHREIINRLLPQSTFSIVLDEEIGKIFVDTDPSEAYDVIKQALFRALSIRFGGKINIPEMFKTLKIRVLTEQTELLHCINAAEHENTIVTFDCEVIAVEREKTYIKSCDAICPVCGTDYVLKANEDRKIPNIYCERSRCKKAKLVTKKPNLITENIQTIYLQEPMSLAKNGSPVIRRGLLSGDLAGKIFIGQKKRITGIFKSEVDLKTNVNDIIIDVISEEDIEEKISNALTPEQIKLYKDLARNEEVFVDKLISSFAPRILGYEEIKLSVLLMLVGGHSSVKREDINILLVGDPSMAKSEMLKVAHRVTDKSMYTSGKGSSAAGLTIGLVKMEQGNYIAQAGVLPLCSGGFAFIDEFDKMSVDDRSALHEAMEQQTVSIAKAGFRMTLPAKTPILAAANPKYGKYDQEQTLLDNIDIPPPLISRFDLIWLIRDVVNKTEDERKAIFILDTFTGSDTIDSTCLSEIELRSYLNHVRELPVVLSDDTKKELLKIYSDMRSLSANGIFVGTRQLEALVRLTMAHAKLLQKGITDKNDVDCVKRIVDSMFLQFNITINGQPTYKQDSLLTTSKQNQQQLADSTWNHCKDENGRVNYSKFIEELSKTGRFTADSAKILFSNWEKECVVKHLGDDLYVRI